VENKTAEMVVKDLLLADNRKKKKIRSTSFARNYHCIAMSCTVIIHSKYKKAVSTGMVLKYVAVIGIGKQCILSKC